jgi:hypothetical protein
VPLLAGRRKPESPSVCEVVPEQIAIAWGPLKERRAARNRLQRPDFAPHRRSPPFAQHARHANSVGDHRFVADVYTEQFLSPINDFGERAQSVQRESILWRIEAICPSRRADTPRQPPCPGALDAGGDGTGRRHQL